MAVTGQAHSPPTNGSPSVLVVEDEAITAMDLAHHLRQFGYGVSGIVHTADDAVTEAQRQSPDLILMDIILGSGRDGISAASEIGAKHDIPVIYLSAYSDEATVERAARTHPYGYLTKPFEPRQVRAAVETALQKVDAERRLQESKRWLFATLRCVGDAVIATKPDGTIYFVNPVAASLLGIVEADWRHRQVEEIVHLEHPEHGKLPEHPMRTVLTTGCPVCIEYGTLLVSAHGRRTPVADSVTPIRSDEGELLGAVMVVRDVSERIRLEENLRASEKRFHSAFLHAANGMALVSLDDHFVQFNGKLAEILRCDEDTLSSKRYCDLLHPEDRVMEIGRRKRLLDGSDEGFQSELRFLRGDGRTVWTLSSVAIIRDVGGEPLCFVHQIHDITKRKRAERELLRLAHFDPLTGLANRALLHAETERAILAAKRNQRQLGVLFLDLDHFKRVNDTLGHDAGDDLLRQIGKRLSDSARSTDLVARLGGDEFVVLVSDVREPDDVLTVANKLRTVVGRPSLVAGQEFSTSVSIGVSIFPDDGVNAATLFRNADSALYQAKLEGRDIVAFYRPELTARSENRMRLETNLRRALDLGQLLFHYQPIVDLTSGNVIAVEALMRWTRDGWTESPTVFIPVAEETGLIVELGAFALEQACRTARPWSSAAGEIAVSVNISARQLREPEFDKMVLDVLERVGLDPTRLWLEITENMLAGVNHTEVVALGALRRLGVSVAIDDFGIGYSSLDYLRQFSPDCMKIDRSFVRNVDSNPNDAAIVSATIAMSQKLGVRVIAEGVETGEELHFLRTEGCDAVQGHLLSRPVAPEHVPQLLSARNITPDA